MMEWIQKFAKTVFKNDLSFMSNRLWGERWVIFFVLEINLSQNNSCSINVERPEEKRKNPQSGIDLKDIALYSLGALNLSRISPAHLLIFSISKHNRCSCRKIYPHLIHVNRRRYGRFIDDQSQRLPDLSSSLIENWYQRVPNFM